MSKQTLTKPLWETDDTELDMDYLIEVLKRIIERAT
jgi:hypothetical protein